MNIFSRFFLQDISLDRLFYLALKNSDFWTHQTSTEHHIPPIVWSPVNDHSSWAQFIVQFWAGSSCLSTAKLCLGEGEAVPFKSFTRWLCAWSISGVSCMEIHDDYCMTEMINNLNILFLELLGTIYCIEWQSEFFLQVSFFVIFQFQSFWVYNNFAIYLW